MHYYVKDYRCRSKTILGFKNVLTVMNDLELRNELAQEHIKYLETQIDLLQKERNYGKATGGLTFSEFRVDTAIKSEYIMYIEKYGVPEDGIFLPSRLAEFM